MVQIAIVMLSADGVVQCYSRLYKLPRIHLHPDARDARERSLESRAHAQEQHPDTHRRLHGARSSVSEGGRILYVGRVRLSPAPRLILAAQLFNYQCDPCAR